MADRPSVTQRRHTVEAINQIARLTVERGQTLRYASSARGKRAVIFFAPGADASLGSNYELMRCAADEAGLSATYFDVSRLAQVPLLKQELARAEALIVLDDEAFRDAPFAKTNVICACRERQDLDWIVVRVGDVIGHDDLEFYLQRGHALEVLDPAIWKLTALFLMQSVAAGPGENDPIG